MDDAGFLIQAFLGGLVSLVTDELIGSAKYSVPTLLVSYGTGVALFFSLNRWANKWVTWCAVGSATACVAAVLRVGVAYGGYVSLLRGLYCFAGQGLTDGTYVLFAMSGCAAGAGIAYLCQRGIWHSVIIGVALGVLLHLKIASTSWISGPAAIVLFLGEFLAPLGMALVSYWIGRQWSRAWRRGLDGDASNDNDFSEPPAAVPGRCSLPMQESSEPGRHQLGLTGLTTNYRVSLVQWERSARPHYRQLVFPAIGYVLLLGLMSLVLVPLATTFFGFAINLLVVPPLAAGLQVVCLAQLTGKEWRFTTFFSGFRWYWPIVARALLLVLIAAAGLLSVFLVIVGICSIWEAIYGSPGPGHEPPAVFLWTVIPLMLLGIMGALYVPLRCAFFSLPLMLDQGCGPVQAIKGSWILSRGHFWRLTGVALLLLFVVLLSGVLTLGIAILVTLPCVILIWDVGYLASAGARQPMKATRPNAS